MLRSEILIKQNNGIEGILTVTINIKKSICANDTLLVLENSPKPVVETLGTLDIYSSFSALIL